MYTTQLTLLSRIQDPADSAAWREFDEVYRPLLKKFAMSAGLDEHEAEEIGQQCMIRIQTKIHSYDAAKGRFRPWLRTLINNRIRDHWRKRRPQHANSTFLKGVQDPDPCPEEVFDKILLDELIQRCFKEVKAEVTPRTFEAYRRYVIDERPVEEVCKELGMNPNALYKIKWRITQKIGEKLRYLLGGDTWVNE